MTGVRTLDRRLGAVEVEVLDLARRFLPRSAADPGDPEVLLKHLTDEEMSRLEAAAQAEADDWPELWADACRRGLSRMLTGVDVRALCDAESDSRVLVEIPSGEPPIPGRTRLVGYVQDMTVPGLWHAESCYRGRLPRTLTTEQLMALEPQPWPPRTAR